MKATECSQSTTHVSRVALIPQLWSATSPQITATECYQSTDYSYGVLPVHRLQLRSATSPQVTATECYQSTDYSYGVLPVHR